LRNAERIGGIGRGSALTGLILGYVTLGIATFVWIFAAAASAASS
jgi:hypothetical protein